MGADSDTHVHCKLYHTITREKNFPCLLQHHDFPLKHSKFCVRFNREVSENVQAIWSPTFQTSKWVYDQI